MWKPRPTQQQHLRELGCDHLQGYLFAKPLPVETLKGWMRQRCEERATA